MSSNYKKSDPEKELVKTILFFFSKCPASVYSVQLLLIVYGIRGLLTEHFGWCGEICDKLCVITLYPSAFTNRKQDSFASR